jgi:hypothetical protein
VTALWRAAMYSALSADGEAHLRGSSWGGEGSETDWVQARSRLERASLARAHATARAHCDRVEGARIWAVAQTGTAPGAAFLRGTLAARHGLGEVVPRGVLEAAGAAAVGRLLSRGDPRDAAAVQAELPPAQQRAFDAWRAPPHPLAALIVAGTIAAQISHPAGPVLTCGLCVLALADLELSACATEGGAAELPWDPTATFATYHWELTSTIRDHVTAFPDGAAGAVSWLLWAGGETR